MKTTVKGTLLCMFLRITPLTLSRWHLNHDLERCGRGVYDIADVDAFLAGHAHNFKITPTWADLRSKKLVLLSAVEIEESYGIPREQLYSLHRTRKLRHFKFPGENGTVRFCQEDIAKLAQKPIGVISGKAVEKLIGREELVVKRLIRAGKLQRAQNPRDAARNHVTIQSVLLYLRVLLPSWVSPEDWIEDCKASEKPLVPLRRAATRLGLTPRKAYRFLEEKHGWYITSPDGKNVMVSPIWLDAQDEYAQPLTTGDVAQLFDVSLQAVRNWEQNGKIKCPIEDHDHTDTPFLLPPCWIAIVSRDLGERQVSFFVTDFVRNRLEGKDGAKLVGVVEASKVLRCGLERIERMVRLGELRGIRTPRGIWRFHPKQLEIVRRRKPR